MSVSVIAATALLICHLSQFLTWKENYHSTVVTQFFIPPADGDPLGQFAIIQADEGEWGLIVKEALDRETKDRYTLRVTATDGKSEAPVTVDVHVLDINDNSPLCEQVSYSILNSSTHC